MTYYETIAESVESGQALERSVPPRIGIVAQRVHRLRAVTRTLLTFSYCIRTLPGNGARW